MQDLGFVANQEATECDSPSEETMHLNKTLFAFLKIKSSLHRQMGRDRWERTPSSLSPVPVHSHRASPEECQFCLFKNGCYIFLINQSSLAAEWLIL